MRPQVVQEANLIITLSFASWLSFVDWWPSPWHPKRYWDILRTHFLPSKFLNWRYFNLTRNALKLTCGKAICDFKNTSKIPASRRYDYGKGSGLEGMKENTENRGIGAFGGREGPEGKWEEPPPQTKFVQGAQVRIRTEWLLYLHSHSRYPYYSPTSS